jgi:hypothetical protein
MCKDLHTGPMKRNKSESEPIFSATKRYQNGSNGSALVARYVVDLMGVAFVLGVF